VTFLFIYIYNDQTLTVSARKKIKIDEIAELLFCDSEPRVTVNMKMVIPMIELYILKQMSKMEF